MVGDGANDVQALRTADVAVAMASGTATARAVAGIVLLNDSFEALIRGTREATAVLGNAARLSKLFLAKSIYAYLLIVATNMLGLAFPVSAAAGLADGAAHARHPGGVHLDQRPAAERGPGFHAQRAARGRCRRRSRSRRRPSSCTCSWRACWAAT